MIAKQQQRWLELEEEWAREAAEAQRELAAARQEAAAAAVKDQQKDTDQLARSMRDVNARIAEQLGTLPRMTAAMRALGQETKELTPAQLMAFEQVTAAEKRLDQIQTLAQGTQQIFEGVFTNIQGGFRGMVTSIVQGFGKMLQQMAAEFLASQVKKAILPHLVQLFGLGAPSQFSGMGGANVAPGFPQGLPSNFSPGGFSGLQTASRGGPAGQVSVNQTFHVTGADPTSFRRNSRQVQADAALRARIAFARNG